MIEEFPPAANLRGNVSGNVSGNNLGAGASSLIFQLPLADLGAGAVDTTPTVHGGSGTATFTRATPAYTTLAAGLLAQVNSGVARSTYSADGLTYLGYLAEGARTNLALQSQTFDVVAAWSSSGGTTVTANTAAAPDGTTTADRLQGTTNAWFYGQPVTIVNGTMYTVSLYVKSNTGSAQAIRLFGDANQSSGDLAVTTAWTRISYTFTSANSAARNHGIQRDVANDTVDILVWGFQVEAGAFASTYIPTTTASVTRNADVLTYVASGNISSVAGSAYAEAYPGSAVGDVGILLSGSNLALALLGTAAAAPLGAELYDGANNPVTAKTLSLNTLGKVASSWGGTSASVVLNGGTVASSSYNGALAGANITVGGNLFGPMRNLRISNRALSAAQLQAMTS